MLKIRRLYLKSLIALGGVATTLSLVNCNGGGFEVASGCFSDGDDPMLSYSWHLVNCGQSVFAKTAALAGVDLNLKASWSSGLTGNGIKVRVSDDGLENTHEDITGNFQTALARSRDYVSGDSNNNYLSTTAVPRDGVVLGKARSDNHGTAVAGIIGAVKGNGIGSRGVAPKVALSIANFLSFLSPGSTVELINQAATDEFDISNMSWGHDQFEINKPISQYETQLRTAVTSYRGGKGAIFVKAAGNSYYEYCADLIATADPNDDDDRACIGNSNFDGDNTNPYQIMVAAINARGTSATYSSPGANLWVSGLGGQYGYDTPALLTTDRTGCSLGYAKSSSSSSVAFEKGTNNSNCKYTATFNGTSSAAPTVTGAIALLLEANPNLTWRDVKYILAKTAVPMDYVTTGTIPHPLSIGMPTGYAWELPWRTNGAGFKFQNWYGFGKVDVDAAVAMAKTYASSFGTYTESGWISSGNINLAIPDNSLTNAALAQISILSGATGAMKVEAVRIRLNITHTDISQLGIELTSPSGMRSIVVNMHNSLVGIGNYVNDVFLTNAFYGERSEGLWTLKVVDGKLDGNSGTLSNWSIEFIGAP